MLVTGAAPMTRVQIGSPPVFVSGPQREMLASVAGLTVEASGTPQADGSLMVGSFTVRDIDGVPVTDGIVRREGAVVAVVSATGQRTVIRSVPDAPAFATGARVWVRLATDGAVQSYGGIAPPR